jgi:hypothetical protein
VGRDYLVEFLEEDAETACVVGGEERIGKALGVHFDDGRSDVWEVVVRNSGEGFGVGGLSPW